MDRKHLVDTYRAILTSRAFDTMELELVSRGQASFHVSSAGHEATAALAPHLIPEDWLHCHYRDRALLLARGLTPRKILDNFLAKDKASGRGRRMTPFMSDPELHILSMVTPTANNALQSAGVAAAVREDPSRPLVYCAVGDGTTQQGEFLEACAEAVRSDLPILFLIQDNRWAISTTTEGKTFYSLPTGRSDEYLGRKIHYVDGRSPVAAYEAFGEIVARMREQRSPEFVVFNVERLTSHTNADDQAVYRGADEIEQAGQTGDPLAYLEAACQECGISSEELRQLRSDVDREMRELVDDAIVDTDPVPYFEAKRSLPVELTHPSREMSELEGEPTLTMREAIRDVLSNHLQEDDRVCLYGEDIEDPKGDVFGVTKGLSTRFPGRVVNSPLAECTILGVSFGRACAGQRPVAFLQFADFLPVAFNQIASELSSLHWRTDGEWSAPVIVMVACGGFRPGLGPFHAQTMESTLAHTPGVDVMMPANATDAAGLLNAAFRSARPTLFLYPKSILNDSQTMTTKNVESHFVPIGVARRVRTGRDITFVGWGNTTRLCEQAAEALEAPGIEAEVIDLRCISPWDEAMILKSAEKTARLVVVHEDNQTCGFGAEILATVASKARVPISMRRVTRADTFVPFNFANQIEVLPSYKRVLETAAELLDLEISWTPPEKEQPGTRIVEAMGSAPSDETVDVVEISVEPGETVTDGQVLATVEAAKSVIDIVSPADGTVAEVFGAVGEPIAVGDPLIKLTVAAEQNFWKPVTQENPGKPVLKRRRSKTTIGLPVREVEHRSFEVGISSVSAVHGSRLVSNKELLSSSERMSSADILRRTGIEARHWVNEKENAVQLAVDACQNLMDRESLSVDELDLVICSTTSPTSVTPSMACRILEGMSKGKSEAMVQAYDINAACSGYLYALQAGYDYLQSTPEGRVLIVTAEVLSPLLDPTDFDTAILFGDATSASILYGEAHMRDAIAKVYRPELCAKAEDGSTLSVPLLHDGFIQMKGRRVFTEAVRSMVASLMRACDSAGIAVEDLKMVVPHQANQRILDAIQSRIDLPVYSNIRNFGNTSSSSIPLCLAEILEKTGSGEQLGLCAFGGGFTFGAGILKAS